ncbi:hypothetical protein D3C76_1306010 [compost metagenome]
MPAIEGDENDLTCTDDSHVTVINPTYSPGSLSTFKVPAPCHARLRSWPSFGSQAWPAPQSRLPTCASRAPTPSVPHWLLPWSRACCNNRGSRPCKCWHPPMPMSNRSAAAPAKARTSGSTLPPMVQAPASPPWPQARPTSRPLRVRSRMPSGWHSMDGVI